MEKVKQTPNLYTGPVKLHLDDIINIVEAFQEIDDKGKLKIIVGGYSLSNIDELSEMKIKEHPSINIELFSNKTWGSCSFSTSGSRTYLSCSEDSIEHHGVFSKVKEIIHSCKRKWYCLESLLYFTLIIATFALVFMVFGRIDKNNILYFIGYFFFFVMCLCFILFLINYKVRKSKIILVDKTDRDTFWKRNKDNIIVAIISSSVSFILGILSTLFFQAIIK